ncbi:MAG TPA: PAS domain S-box protein [Victivallales bacterium]|nr:PAS domain S-box protein [Victivallales bacterium]
MFDRVKFKLLRKQQRMSAQYIAQKIGKSRHAVSAWELGRRNPKEAQIRALANLLNVSVSEISDLIEIDKVLTKTEYNLPKFADSWIKFANYDAEEFKELQRKAARTLSDINNKICNELTQNSIVIKALTTAMPSIFYVKDANLKFITVNHLFLKLAGLHSEFNVLGHDDYKFFPRIDAKTNKEEDEKVLYSGIQIINSKGFLPGSRRKKIAFISKIPITDKNNKLLGLVGVFTDITKQEESKFKLELFNKILYEDLTDGVWFSLSTGNKFIYFNKAMEKICGYSIEEINKDKELWLNITHPEDRQIVIDTCYAKPPRDSIIKYRIIAKNRQLKWINVNITWAEYQGKLYCIGTARDITAEKNRETEFRTHINAFDNISEAVWISKNGRIIYANKIIEKLYECTLSEFLTKPIRRKAICNIDKDGRLKKRIELLNNSNHNQINLKYKIIRKDGKTVDVEEDIFLKINDDDAYQTGIIKILSEL